MAAPLLHDRFPALGGTLPHVPLGDRPTPVRRVAGLDRGGAEVWVKDDGEFGAGGWGGNKVRKLEWLLGEAERRDKDSILTFGGLGTNWGLATALYARERGIATALALLDQPVDDHVRAQLDRLARSGAALHRTHTKARTVAALPWLMARHSTRGRPPYLLPAGGSSPVGALGYVEAGLEIAAQVEAGDLPEPAFVVAPVGTGGTVAGLTIGLALGGLATAVVGVVVNDKLRLDHPALTKLAGRTAALLAKRGAPVGARPASLRVERGWLGAGYGHATGEGTDATADSAAAGGPALDPVYTAKAMAALLALAEAGSLGSGPVLFLHTDGPRPG